MLGNYASGILIRKESLLERSGRKSQYNEVGGSGNGSLGEALAAQV